MSIFQGLLFLFVAIPLLEIYILIQVGGWLGAVPTIFLVVFTAVLGVLLVRMQGFATLQRVRQMLEAGELPAVELLEGVVLLLAGALLLTPGFFTDAIAFSCLVPPLHKRLISQFIQSKLIPQDHKGQAHEAQPDKHGRKAKTIEGEYRREDD